MSDFIERLVIDKERKGSYLLTLDVGNELKDIVIETPIVRTPFGIEKYKNKDVINIEFTNKDHDNEVHNFYSKIKGIEEVLKEKLYIDDLDICNMEFVTSVKQSGKYDPMLRVNITNDSEIPYDGCPKNTKLKAVIKLKKVWAWDDRWGLFYEIVRIDNQD